MNVWKFWDWGEGQTKDAMQGEYFTLWEQKFQKSESAENLISLSRDVNKFESAKKFKYLQGNVSKFWDWPTGQTKDVKQEELSNLLIFTKREKPQRDHPKTSIDGEPEKLSKIRPTNLRLAENQTKYAMRGKPFVEKKHTVQN